MSEATTAVPKKSKKKLVLVLSALLVMASGGAGAAWFVLQPGARTADAAPAAPVARKQLYQPLDVFTVNLQDPRGERFAQIGVTLQYESPEVEVGIKDNLPAVRNEILLLLSSKQPDQLLSADGKQQLAQQIHAAVGRSLGYVEKKRPAAGNGEPEGSDASTARASAHPIKAVLFSQFIVQ